MKILLRGLPALWLAGCVAHTGAPAQRLPVPPPVAVSAASTVYATADGIPLRAEFLRPPGEGPFPAVLLVHGGGWVGGSPQDMATLARKIAAQGFVTVNMAYRLAPQHRHPAQIDDVAAALAWMRAEGRALGIDPARIAVWGYSAGAHLAALAGTRLPPERRPQAVVAGGLPADLTRYPKSPLIAQLMGTTLADDPEGWRDASPVFHVDPDASPMFLYHGTWDWVVGAVNARLMAERLAAAGVAHERYLIRGYGHFAAFLWHRGAEDAALDFLRRNLAAGG
jgi:acetyl esterase/lipase